jgi:hypothetical protein
MTIENIPEDLDIPAFLLKEIYFYNVFSCNSRNETLPLPAFAIAASCLRAEVLPCLGRSRFGILFCQGEGDNFFLKKSQETTKMNQEMYSLIVI